MRHHIKDFVSFKALRHLPYIFLIIIKIKNWPLFLANYIGFKNCAATYYFRNGLKIQTSEGVDAATITVVFIKKDYGKTPTNAIIIDIGANIGAYSLYAAATSNNSTIYAYEPMPKTFELLQKNIHLNNFQKTINVFKLGVAAQKEKRSLYILGDSPFNSLYSNKKAQKAVIINCISLKNIFDDNKIENCNLLKMDCEGAEFEIFYNTPSEYLKKIKEIHLEYHDQIDDQKNIKNLTIFLEKAGFKLCKKRKDSSSTGNAWFRQLDEA